MFLLKLIESGREHLIGAFDSEANIKAFLEKIPGFEVYSGDEYGILGKLHVAALGDLVEIAYGKKKIPLSKFSFVDDEADAIAIEVEAFDDGKANTVEGCTLVDAYLIGNNELKTYIEKRERNFLRVKARVGKTRLFRLSRVSRLRRRRSGYISGCKRSVPVFNAHGSGLC
nr:hypothetical protein [Treponema denticola]